MSFNIANFAPVGNSSKPVSGLGTATLKGAPSIWSYITADAVNTVSAANYFNDASRHLNAGDLIYTVCGAGSGGTPAPRLFYVNSVNKTTGAVDVADGTAVSVTDTY
nr:MAG TPA: hypothetical protein [Caudoviricetes sp.]